MFVKFGNFTLDDFISYTGAVFTAEEVTVLNGLRRNNADVKGTGGFHIFEYPLSVHMDESISETVIEIFTKANERRTFINSVSFHVETNRDVIATSKHGDVAVSILVDNDSGNYFAKIDRTRYSSEPEVEIREVTVEEAVNLYLGGKSRTNTRNVSYKGADFWSHHDEFLASHNKKIRYSNVERNDSVDYGVACSFCGANVLESCTTKTYLPSATSAHKARKNESIVQYFNKH